MTRLRPLLAVTVLVMVTVLSGIVAQPISAYADAGHIVLAAPTDLKAVINNIQGWLVTLLVSLATLFATVGGIRYLIAGGDPAEVEKAKHTLRYAAIGYCVAMLAPLLVSILQKFVS